MAVVLGIDLGTSYSCAEAVWNDAIVLVEDDRGRPTMPSVVHFATGGKVTTGREALARSAGDPENTIHSAKRMLGCRYGDPAVRIAQSAYLYRIQAGPNRWPLIAAEGGPYAVAAVCAYILRSLRNRAEKFFGEPVEQAVITVPANATDSQREQTRIAGRMAGLEVLALLNEPTAAAHAYALLRVGGQLMAVYDFGGGTFDCSVIKWGSTSSRVLATHGDSFLGGDDIDLALAVHVAQEFQRQTGVDIRQRAADWKLLLRRCEEAKCKLSGLVSAEIRLPRVAQTPGGAVDLEHVITRDLLGRLAAPFVAQTVEIMDATLQMADVGKTALDQVLLVGGSSRLPLVSESVRRSLGQTPLVDIDPDTAVCIGAAAEAHRLAGGVSPATQTDFAAVEEVVPRSFGLATAGGGFDAIIPRNSRLPAGDTRTYTTWRDGQQEMRFVVLQGDSEQAADNYRLGEFVVGQLPVAPAGDVQIELRFEVGADSLLRVSARDPLSGRVHSMGIRVGDVYPPGDA